jgi:hypothetical protein
VTTSAEVPAISTDVICRLRLPPSMLGLVAALTLCRRRVWPHPKLSTCMVMVIAEPGPPETSDREHNLHDLRVSSVPPVITCMAILALPANVITWLAAAVAGSRAEVQITRYENVGAPCSVGKWPPHPHAAP